jgi:hypothetical protein
VLPRAVVRPAFSSARIVGRPAVAVGSFASSTWAGHSTTAPGCRRAPRAQSRAGIIRLPWGCT